MVAIGVTRRRSWARAIAILIGARLLVIGVSGLFGAVLLAAQGLWPNPFSLVDTVMGLLVLYGMGARWSPPSASSDREAISRR